MLHYTPGRRNKNKNNLLIIELEEKKRCFAEIVFEFHIGGRYVKLSVCNSNVQCSGYSGKQQEQLTPKDLRRVAGKGLTRLCKSNF